MDACWFNYQAFFNKKKYAFTSDFVTLAAYHKGYSGLMSHWHETLPGFIHDLSYDRLVTDTNNEMSRLLSFIGLEWEGAYLDRYEDKPLHGDDIESWRHYEIHLAPLLEALG